MARMSSIARRRELVEAALRVIAQHGMAGATTRAIVAEAGMPLASFHYAFESRDEMMRELIAFVVESEAVAVFDSFKFRADVRSSIRDAFAAFLATITADPSHELVMFELTQYALRTPGLEHLAREQWERYRGTVAEILRAAAVNNGIEWALPVDDVARIAVTFSDGITFAWLADRDLEGATRVIEFAADSIATLAIPVRQKEHTP